MTSLSMKKIISLLLVIIVVILYKYLSVYRTIHPSEKIEQHIGRIPADQNIKKENDDHNYLELLRSNPLDYSKHARCRMDCRHIAEEEVIEILAQGKINWSKTDLQAQPCPSFAIDGTTKDQQKVRIVFAGCEEETKVVTVIDLKTDWACDCH